MKIFCLDHNQILKEIKKHFEVVTDITKADRVILWNDINAVERGIINYARRLKIPVVVMQHGRRGTSRYYPPFSEPITADKLLVWGEADKQALIDAGQDSNKIKVTGTTVFSELKGRLPHKGVNVVFSPEHWDSPLEENKLVRKKLRQLKGVNIITKLIDSPSHDNLSWDNPIISNRGAEDHLSICADVLSTADLVVGISESTFELMAQYLDIPVVIMDTWYPKPFMGMNQYIAYRRIVSRASKTTDVNNLVKTIQQQLKNPDELKQERAEVVIEEGGANLDALNEIKREIITI